MNLKITKLYVCFLACLTLGLSSCKKNDTPEQPVKPSANDYKVDYVLPPNLTWTDQYYPWGATNVLSPFAGGTSREFPTEYISDINAVDGWELYLNTFSTSLIDPQKKYFVIYNRYRGLLRIYYYLDNANFSPTKSIIWELGLHGSANNSTILNFEQGELIDNATKLTYTTKVQLQKKVQPNGCWYAEQFELAYDADAYPQDYRANALKIGLYSQDVTQYSFAGTQSGTIDGSIQVPKSSGSGFWSTLFNGAIDLGLGAIGSGASGALKTVFKTGFSSLKIKQIDSTALDYIATSATIKGLPKSIFNAILGKSSGGTTYSSEKVSLKINTSIKLDGTGTASPTGLGTFNTYLSGTQNLYSADSGIIPLYPRKLGVFNITGTPIVHMDMFHLIEETSSTTTAQYYLDDTSYSINWNPDLINQSAEGASIQNLKKDIILVDASSPVTGTGYTLEYVTPQDATYVSFVSDGIMSFSRVFKSVNPTNWSPNVRSYALRISFDVVPNNGSARTTIIKTLIAGHSTTIY